MNKKIPVVLAVAMAATTLATFPPCARSQGTGARPLPPQLQTDAQRKAARIAREVPVQGMEGAAVQPAGPAGGDPMPAALGVAVLADVADAAAASAHNDATRSSRRPGREPALRGAGSRTDPWAGELPDPRQGDDPR